MFFYWYRLGLTLQIMDNLVSILKNNRSLFEKIVPFNSGKDGLLLLDFTAENPELTDNVLEDVRSLSAYINRKLENSQVAIWYWRIWRA